ncbi:non-ribosomal peptide synthetase [Rhodococcus opacus]|uniref:non-ribosomal peptide synthetase n=1 Tax=Rhodococcus opacus TaxID=37919 RepID=UPI000317BAEB|nr:non-ribosomal peptide synthetase [Rhodococcus opacus]
MSPSDVDPNLAAQERRRTLLRRKLTERNLTADTVRAHAVRKRDPRSRFPLSEGQRRMWFVHDLDPTHAALNIGVGVELEGALDTDRLFRSVQTVTARHDLLRTTYHTDADGTPFQVVAERGTPAWTVHDVSGLAVGERDEQIGRLAAEEFARPFDLTTDPPLRTTVIRTAPNRHVLLLVAHHIAWDDDSWGLFFADLGEAYESTAPVDALRIRDDTAQYLDVEVLDRPDTSDADREDVAYWRSVYAQPPEALELPGEHGRPSAVPAVSAALGGRVPDEVAERVRALAHKTGATPFMVLLAAFVAVVHRYTGSADLLTATPVVNRPAAAGRALGYFGNTVVLRNRVDPRGSFRSLVEHTRDVAVGAFTHQGAGLDRVVREVNPGRGGGLDALPRLGFGVRSGIGTGFRPPGITCARTDLHGAVAQVPLGVMAEFDDGITLELEYQTEVLDENLAAQLLRHFVQFLSAASEEPDRPIDVIDLLGADRARVSDWSRGARAPAATRTLPDLVQARIAETPDAVALVLDDLRISYAELGARANRLAHWLIAQSIGPEDLVALPFGRSVEMVVAALAVVQTGAAYLPIDPTYPADRIEYLLTDARPTSTLDDLDAAEAAAQDFPATPPTDADRVRPLRTANLAYVIYTSGSTGLPKGVAISHAAIVEHFEWMEREYVAYSDDALLQVASTSFDVSVGEIFGTLFGGARLVIPKPDGLTDIPYLTTLLRTEHVTAMHFVPSLLGLFLMLPGAEEWTSLRRVPIGGEALPGELADKFTATFDAMLHNFYGPTETTLAATRFKVEGAQGTRTVPIGTPKANTEVYVLDPVLGLVPPGVVGEVYIGGSQLARGYLGRPALTAERFVADPHTPCGRLYRTGDLARWNSDGDLEFVGRADDQVKIRGYRIELGEVEAAVTAHPAVAAAVVIAHESEAAGKSLAAYVVAASPDALDTADVRARVADALPEHMVPATVTVVREIPITANGKLDRGALPAPEPQAPAPSREPSTPTEARLCAIFADALGRDRVGVDESFFDLGGHSLLATRLVSRLRAEFGADVSIRDAFEVPTVAGLAALVDARGEAAGASPRPGLRRAERPPRIPLSYAQLRLWFLYRLEGPNPTYDIPFAARIDGPLDAGALAEAIGDVVARHEILRTTYPDHEGKPYQLVHDPSPIDVPLVDLGAHGDRESRLAAELAEAAAHSFVLESELPIRARILRLAPGEHVVSLVIHHIAGDEWSAPILFGDLAVAYAARLGGTAPAWPELPLQYADYALWQREMLDDDTSTDTVGGRQIAYWRSVLADLPEDTTVLRDRPRPPIASSRGDTVTFAVPDRVHAGLTELARTCGASEFMILQTAVAVLLAKLGAGEDIPLGTPVAGRAEHDLREIVGFFVNTLVLRNDLSGNPTLRTAVLRARETALGAFSHQDLPFERLVDVLGPDRSLSRHPLFQVLVHLRESGAHSEVRAVGVGRDVRLTTIVPESGTAKFDLTVDFHVTDGELRGGLNYRTDLYDRRTVERLATWLGRVLAEFADHPDRHLRDVDVSAPADRERLLGWSRGDAPDPAAPASVPELLEPSRAFGPDVIAVECGDDTVTYPRLHVLSDRLAALLRRRGAGPGTFVALAVPRSIDMVVALVAVMKSGAAFLPLDLRYPAERLAFMIADAAPVCVVTTGAVGGTLPPVPGVDLLVLDDPATIHDLAGVAVETLPFPRGDEAAYFLFTSGSTGRPKGVVGTHRAMANRLAWQPRLFPVHPPADAPDAGDVRLAQGSLSFLDGGLELLAGIAAGARLILADDAEARDLEALARLLGRHPIGQVTAVASAVSVLVDTAPDVVRRVPRWVCSGEPLTPSLLAALAGTAPDSDIVNAYGTTETAGSIVRGLMEPGVLRVGRPVPGVRLLVLDDALKPVPQGVVGEIYVAGAQLARGYWNRPGLTAARFVAHPSPDRAGERLYRTGDRGSWNPDGHLCFAGRTDHQVKVRGYRIELGEVENALRSAPGVATAAARTYGRDGATSLAGYVVPRDTGPDRDEGQFLAAVRAHLDRTLPGYMLPATVTALETMPTTGSGKLDRLSLPVPQVATAGHFEPPVTATERALAALFEEILGVTEVGRSDGFFTLGGDSIVSIQLAGRARSAGLVLTPQLVFEYSTLAELAEACDRAAAQAEPEPEPAEPSAPMSVSGLDPDQLAALRKSWDARG